MDKEKIIEFCKKQIDDNIKYMEHDRQIKRYNEADEEKGKIEAYKEVIDFLCVNG